MGRQLCSCAPGGSEVMVALECLLLRTEGDVYCLVVHNNFTET